MTTVAFTVYRRPFYLRDVLAMWKEVRGFNQCVVEFNIDPSDQQEVQHRICTEFAASHPAPTRVTINDEHQGVLKAPWLAIEKAFRAQEHLAKGAFNDGRVVLAEEDVAVSDDVLEYMEWALDCADIACAWSDDNGAENEAETRLWFNPWCWGVNRDIWDEVLSPTWDTDYSHGGWDTQIGLELVRTHGLRVLFPRASRSQHIGQWMGAHQDPSNHGVQELPESFREHREPQEWRLERRAVFT